MVNLYTPCLSINEKGHLAISGCDAVELARQYGTPLYVMSEDEIRRVCRSYVESFQNFYGGNGRPIYASKAFSCKEMCRIVTSSSQRVPLVELASDLLRVLLLVVLPLTVLAAVMECYVTPVVMGLFL